ncbi:MAG: metallophosphoesterase family protein [Anaerolineae bacterium]
MKFAVISDIHGNLPALDAVLDHIASRHPDEVVVAGDLVNRGPQSAEVVARLRPLGYPTVKGNHERYVLAQAHGHHHEEHGDDYAPSRWAARQLDEDAIAYLDDLPATLCVGDFLVVHGSPRGDQDGIFRRHTDHDLQDRLASHPAVICGHTHVSLVRHWSGGMVVNAGSAGNTFEGDTLARYAWLENRHDGWHAEIVSLAYDVDAALRAFDQGDYLAEGGPMARLFRVEIASGRNHLIPAYLAHREAVEARQMTLTQAVALYLASLEH